MVDSAEVPPGTTRSTHTPLTNERLFVYLPVMEAADINLFDPDNYAAGGPPHEQFRWLRTHAPVFRHALPTTGRYGKDPVWAITRYRDIERISLNQKLFSSARTGVILREFSPEEYENVKGHLINMDPPQHSKFRKILSAGFTPKMLRNLEPHVREIARGIVDAVIEKGSCDFVTEIAAELPLQVIVEMMGVPIGDRHRVFDWSNKMLGYDDPEYQADELTPHIAAAEFYMYANELAEQRLAQPKDDLASVLLHAEVDGERLSTIDFNSFFLLLAVAGNETTRNLISGGMLALFQHPDELARLRRDPGLMPTAVDEMLRWVTPVNLFRRTVTEDTELRGVRLAEGDRVVLFYASANRDEEIFSEPERFDIGRKANDHLAFGFGPHFCLGAHLARMEIRIMFEELMRRMPDLEQVGPAERLRSNFINGIKRLPVRFTPGGRASRAA